MTDIVRFWVSANHEMAGAHSCIHGGVSISEMTGVTPYAWLFQDNPRSQAEAEVFSKSSGVWRLNLGNGPVLSIVIYPPQNARHDQVGDSHFDWDFAYPEVFFQPIEGEYIQNYTMSPNGPNYLLHVGSEKGPSSGLSVLGTNCYSSCGGMGPCAVATPRLLFTVEGCYVVKGLFSPWFLGYTHSESNGHFQKKMMCKLSGTFWWKRSSIKKPNRKRMTNRKRLRYPSSHNHGS